MKSLRSTFAVLIVAAFATATGFVGFNFFQNSQFARAAERVEITREQLARIDDLSTVFRYVGKVVEPSVVNIVVTKSDRPGGMRQFNLPLDKEHLKRFFPDRDGDGEPDLPDMDESETPFEQHGSGSGVIMEVSDGFAYIVTNNHVAGDATQLEINLADGRKVSSGTVIGADKKTDLAVIKVKLDRVIPARWGNSDDLQKGDWIMAFGSPFGYVGSMTHGIVSALNRQAGILGQQGYENFIQVDAPINPGNSGGPLVNTRGEVVGINTAIASRTGSFSGIGFAIPSNQAKFVYESIKNKGKVVRGWLGVSISDVARNLPKAQSFGFDGRNGVLVEQIVPNTPAIGRLKKGDIITAIDGKAVETVQALRSTVAALAPDTDVKMTVFRDGKESTVTLKLGEQPDNVMAANLPGRQRNVPPPAAHADTAKLGLRLSDPTPDVQKSFDLSGVKSGAIVTQVDRGGLAAKAGILPGDLITEVGRAEVKDADEANKAIAEADLKKGVRLYVTSKDPALGTTMARFVFIRENN